MKKKIAILLTSALTLGSMAAGVTAFAATSVEVTNAAVAEITVTVTDRNEGEKVNILVGEKDVTIEELESDVSKITHQGSIIASGTGNDKYVFRLNLPEEFESEDYKVYVSGEESSYELYYVKFSKVVKIAKSIKKETDYVTLANIIKNKKREMSFVNPLFDVADYQSVAKKLIAEEAKNPLDFSDEEKAVKELQRRVKEFSCLSCFEEGNKDVLFKDGAYLYNDVVAINGIDTANVTVNNTYDTVLSNTGKNAVIDGLMNKNLTDVDDLQELYAKNVLLQAIKNPTYDGYGYISDILTKGNAEFVGLSIDKYINLSDKLSANKKIASAKSSITLDNLESTILNAASSNSNGGSNGGGGGGSSTPPSGSIVTPKDPANEVNDSVIPSGTGVFKDMKNHWAKEAVEYLYEKKIISGYTDEEFGPDNSLTREQACKILALAFEKKGSSSIEYIDVKEGDWFYQYVSALAADGVIQGISDNEFGTGNSVTREEFCVMLYRLLGEEKAEKGSSFGDGNIISDWAKEAVDSLLEKGIIDGFDDGTFGPQNVLTRAQAAKLIYSIIENK